MLLPQEQNNQNWAKRVEIELQKAIWEDERRNKLLEKENKEEGKVQNIIEKILSEVNTTIGRTNFGQGPSMSTRVNGRALLSYPDFIEYINLSDKRGLSDTDDPFIINVSCGIIIVEADFDLEESKIELEVNFVKSTSLSPKKKVNPGILNQIKSSANRIDYGPLEAEKIKKALEKYSALHVNKDT